MDIVKRLRDKDIGGFEIDFEAADEIERLRATLCRIAELSDTSKDEGPSTRYWNIAEINDLCNDALEDD